MQAITQLVTDLDDRWRRLSYQQAAFPRLAADALDRAALHRHVGPDQVLAWVFEDQRVEHLPAQRSTFARFTLHSGPRFEVFALMWADVILELHNHTWAGAYQLVAGSSLEAQFRFTERERISQRFKLGQLDLVRTYALTPGDTVAVEPGPHWIHGLGYDTRPGVSIAIRATDRAGHVRLHYWRPGVALEADAPDPVSTIRLNALEFVHATRPERYVELASRWLRSSDLHAAHHAIDHATRVLPADALASVVAAGRERHGDAIDLLLAAARDTRRFELVHALRHQSHDPRARALLTALYFCPDQPAVLAAMGLSDPAALLPILAAVPLRTALSPSMLAIAGHLLDQPDAAYVLARLREDHGADEVAAQAPLVHEACTALIGHAVLHPLFVVGAGRPALATRAAAV